MKFKQNLINEEHFDFKKTEKIKSSKKSIFGAVFYVLFMLDMSATIYKMESYNQQYKQKLNHDYISYNNLTASHKEFKENKNEVLKVDIAKIKQGFTNYKPQTQIGKLLLLNEYVFFKNQYYKYQQDNPYTPEDEKNIEAALEGVVTNDTFAKKDNSIDCGISITCQFVGYYMNQKINYWDNRLEELKRKKLFEVNHKEEMQKFMELSVEERLELFKNKKDPYSRYIW